jgi:hypothetical protein
MAKKANKNSAKARRRGKGPNYIQLFRYVLDCAAYVSLSAKARVALIEVTRGYNGSNNGAIVLSVRQLAERMCCDPYTAALALRSREIETPERWGNSAHSKTNNGGEIPHTSISTTVCHLEAKGDGAPPTAEKILPRA